VIVWGYQSRDVSALSRGRLTNEAIVLDFTSALYLGMRHPSASLRPWSNLTTGRPAVLGTPSSQWPIAQAIADLVGCERATLGPSTLHLFWDLFGLLAREDVAIYVDAGAYPIARWGAERAARCGMPLGVFPHHAPDVLHQWLRRDAYQQRQPVVVTDGFCPGCGAVAPLAAYHASVQAYGGYLIIDDTQALGILGQPCGCDSAPYGTGGGGSLRWCGISGPEIVVVNSLAKGFGVPLAVLAGRNNLVAAFEDQSETQVHCSPPSVATLRAAEHALALNEARGDSLRSHLAALVRQFRRRLAALGLAAGKGLFPVQTLAPLPRLDPGLIHRHLLEMGIRAVLHRPRCQHRAAISFLMMALHCLTDLSRAVSGLANAIRGAGATPVKSFEVEHEYGDYRFGTS
jgi:8-amino-7-oxononanoate synthase